MPANFHSYDSKSYWFPLTACQLSGLSFSFCQCPDMISVLSALKQNMSPAPRAAQRWRGLQIKKPSPGCAHQAVQRCSPGRFNTYILFYGPFLIHHNTASVLLTSPAKHTSFLVPSLFFFSLASPKHMAASSSASPWSSKAWVHNHIVLLAHMAPNLTLGKSDGEVNGYIFAIQTELSLPVGWVYFPAVPCLNHVWDQVGLPA